MNFNKMITAITTDDSQSLQNTSGTSASKLKSFKLDLPYAKLPTNAQSPLSFKYSDDSTTLSTNAAHIKSNRDLNIDGFSWISDKFDKYIGEIIKENHEEKEN